MNNEPVAWIEENGMVRFDVRWASQMQGKEPIPLYTHPVKEHFEDEPQAEELHEILQSNLELTDSEIQEISHRYHYTYNPDYIGFARAILRKAQEK